MVLNVATVEFVFYLSHWCAAHLNYLWTPLRTEENLKNYLPYRLSMYCLCVRLPLVIQQWRLNLQLLNKVSLFFLFLGVAFSGPSAASSGPASRRQEEAGEDRGSSGKSRVVSSEKSNPKYVNWSYLSWWILPISMFQAAHCHYCLWLDSKNLNWLSEPNISKYLPLVFFIGSCWEVLGEGDFSPQIQPKSPIFPTLGRIQMWGSETPGPGSTDHLNGNVFVITVCIFANAQITVFRLTMKFLLYNLFLLNFWKLKSNSFGFSKKIW